MLNYISLFIVVINYFQAAAESNDRQLDYTQDVRKLTKILHRLILQKETIIHDIKVLRLKGRPLPPILPLAMGGTTKSMTGQIQSQDSDDLASNESQPEGKQHEKFNEELEEKGVGKECEESDSTKDKLPHT